MDNISEVATSDLNSSLKRFFGFDSFKGLQQPVVENLLRGNNTFVIMPTGAGKSLCYQLPALMLEGTAIVISPLIALMKNQVDSIRALSDDEDVAAFLNSSLNKTEAKKVRANVLSGITKLLYVAPESLAKEQNLEFLKAAKISFIAVDEAHCISEWGHDFRPEYRNIRDMSNQLGEIPIIALTATATEKVQADIIKNLCIQDAKVFKSSFNRQNLYYEVRPKINADKEIIKFIKENEGKSGIIYTLSRKSSEELSDLLRANGIKSRPYHAGLDASTRAENQDKFLMEEVDVIVATIAFGMGIDKPDVRFVIHYDMPKSIESYYQETGRSGRDGLEGSCISFFRQKDIDKLKKFNKNKGVAEREIGDLLIEEVVNYAESGICRRKLILKYFGEEFDEKQCNSMCDACKNPNTKLEATQELKLLLEVVDFLGNQFNSEHIVHFMSGSENETITRYRHQTNKHFGIGKEKGSRFWKAMIKYAVVFGYLDKEVEKYGVLLLNDRGRKYIANPTTVDLPEDNDFSKATASSGSSQGKAQAADPVLYKMLLDLRKEIAKERGVPPYVVFQEPTIEEMSTRYPITASELQDLSGVSAGKARKFAAPFLELIENYVKENDIDRPDDLVMKSMQNGKSIKAEIIRNIDMKIPLEDISSNAGVDVDEVLDDLYAMVNNGTKVNIDYHIEELLDEDMQDEIYDYYLETETDDIEAAYYEFDEDYSREELKLMLIKFASEEGH